MSSSPNEILNSIGKVVETAPQIYDDALQPTLKETGKLIERIPKAINAALSGIDIWIANKEYNIEVTKKILYQKLKNIDTNQIVPPEPYVAVPALQAISYTMNSEDLYNLYANLLAKSMTRSTKKDVHPSFVEIIKQMSPLDTQILKFIKEKNYLLPILTMKLESKLDNENTIIIPNLINFCPDGLDFRDINISIDNLIRLNFINVTYSKEYSELHEYNSIIDLFIPKIVKVFPKPYFIENPTYHSGVLSCPILCKEFCSICMD